MDSLCARVCVCVRVFRQNIVIEDDVNVTFVGWQIYESERTGYLSIFFGVDWDTKIFLQLLVFR